MQECIVEYLFHNSAIVLLWDKLIFSLENYIVDDNVIHAICMVLIRALLDILYIKRRVRVNQILVGIVELEVLGYG